MIREGGKEIKDCNKILSAAQCESYPYFIMLYLNTKLANKKIQNAQEIKRTLFNGTKFHAASFFSWQNIKVFCPMKKCSFNLLCILNLFSEQWQSTLFQIFVVVDKKQKQPQRKFRLNTESWNGLKQCVLQKQQQQQQQQQQQKPSYLDPEKLVSPDCLGPHQGRWHCRGAWGSCHHNDHTSCLVQTATRCLLGIAGSATGPGCCGPYLPGPGRHCFWGWCLNLSIWGIKAHLSMQLPSFSDRT